MIPVQRNAGYGTNLASLRFGMCYLPFRHPPFCASRSLISGRKPSTLATLQLTMTFWVSRSACFLLRLPKLFTASAIRALLSVERFSVAVSPRASIFSATCHDFGTLLRTRWCHRRVVQEGPTIRRYHARHYFPEAFAELPRRRSRRFEFRAERCRFGTRGYR
jgi:hypothetical protein